MKLLASAAFLAVIPLLLVAAGLTWLVDRYVMGTR